jgi:hypothetical protein
MFTISILNQKMRNLLPIAWKSLGYIFDLSMIQSQADAKGAVTRSEGGTSSCHFQGSVGYFC